MDTEALKFILPRGIHITERPLANGSKSRFFRVQMNRKGVKVDQIFEELEPALAFLNEHRLKLGLEKVSLQNISVDEQAQKAFVKRMKNPTFAEYVQAYINEYVTPKYREFSDIVSHYEYLVKVENDKYKNELISKREYYANIKKIRAKFPTLAEAKQKDRYKKNIESFYKCICEKQVSYASLGSLGVSMKMTEGILSKSFGEFTLKEIKPKTINSYIKSRIADGMKASSIQREVTFISNVFSKIHKLNEEFDSPVENPALDYDKELLEAAKKSKERKFRFTEDKKEAFFLGVEQHENPEFRAIVKLMILTAMRRSEVVLLRWNQVNLDEECIDLIEAKGKDRTVYLTKEAIEVLESLPKHHDRVFPSYSSVIGFEGSFTKFVKEKKFYNSAGELIDCSDITCHKLRKEAVSIFVEMIGADNSLFISEFLGLRAIRKLEANIREMPSKNLHSQSDLLKSVGHVNSNITKKHYFSFLRKK